MKIREKIVRTIAAWLADITVANGYQNDFPEIKVWSIDTEDPENASLWCSVRDASTSFSNNPVARTLELEVRVACANQNDNYATIQSMIEDVYKMMCAKQRDLLAVVGAGAIIEPVNDVLDKDRTSKEIFGAMIKFNITYSRNAQWNNDERDFS